MTTFQDAYRYLIEPSPEEPELHPTRDTVFRDLIFKLLTTAPAFRVRFAEVSKNAGYLSLDGEHFSSEVDMVAELQDGGEAAIQCRLTPTREEVQSFLREAAHEPRYTECLVFTALDKEKIGGVVLRQPKPIQVLDPRALDALDPPIDWDSLIDDEDLRSSAGLAGVRPPRAAVAEARGHIMNAIDGIRGVLQEMEGPLDRGELGEAETAEYRLLHDVVHPTLVGVNKRLDDMPAAEARAWGDVVQRLAAFLESAKFASAVQIVLISAANALSSMYL